MNQNDLESEVLRTAQHAQQYLEVGDIVVNILLEKKRRLTMMIVSMEEFHSRKYTVLLCSDSSQVGIFFQEALIPMAGILLKRIE